MASHSSNKRCRAVGINAVHHRLPQPGDRGRERRRDGGGLPARGKLRSCRRGESAEFATPGVNIGLFCSTPMVALSRNIARKAAMEMLLLGEMVSAAKAKELGLVNWVVPDTDVLSAAIEVAEKIASKSHLTLAIGKKRPFIGKPTAPGRGL